MIQQTRNFPNFLDSWLKYANDDFAPEIYHYWTGISLISAALERRCWIRLSQNSVLFPNLYIFLIGKPANGKSTAADTGIDFLKTHGKVSLIPTQITPASLIDVMSDRSESINGLNPPMNRQCGGLWYASEASKSFEEIAGSIVPTFTDWFGCPSEWSKETKKDGLTKLENVYFNILACTTQNHLAKLIPPDDIGGGFASRLLYVIYEGKVNRNYTLRNARKRNLDLCDKLAFDYSQINNLCGEFTLTDEFEQQYAKDANEFHNKIQDMDSEKMQGLLGRKVTNVLKLAMVMCASYGNEMILTAEHWEMAKKSYQTIEASFSRIVHLAADLRLGNINASLMITKLLAGAGGYMAAQTVKTRLLLSGINKNDIEMTINEMINNKIIEVMQFKGSNGTMYKLLIDPSQHV